MDMNESALNRWTNLIASVGVLLGLVLVAYELRQNSDLMRLQIAQTRADAAMVSNEQTYESAHIPGTLVKIQERKALSAEEWIRYVACELARNMSGIEDDYKDKPIDVSDVPLEDTPPLPANFAIPTNEAEGFALRRNPEPGTRMFEKHPTRDWTETDWRRYMYGYDRLLEMVDAHIERVIDEVEAQGLLDDTLIIYPSDHGDWHAAHQWSQKMAFYEEAINVPFIVSWKSRTRAGYIDEETLSSTGLDLFPTLLSFAGVPVPRSLRGLDLSQHVLAEPSGETPPERRYVVSEINQARLKGRMLVTQDFKYILFDGGAHPEQLFDLANDPARHFPD